MFCIYLIEREDGLKYIGETNLKRLERRMYDHKRSKRFRTIPIKEYIVLYKSEDRNSILEKQTEFISHYDTYRNGLNKTPTGAGRHNHSYKFTTLGFRMEKETKQKIGLASRARKSYLVMNTPEARKKAIKKMKITRKLQGNAPRKFSQNDIQQLLTLYQKHPNMPMVGTIQRNGKMLSYERAFAKSYARQFKMTPTYIINLIRGKTRCWKEITNERS